MKQKVFFTLFAIFSYTLTATSQIHHSIGAGLVIGTGKIPKGAEQGSETPTILGFGVFYHPRYNITETENGAISVGLPLTLGISGSVNSREGGSISIIADLPITADYNFGAGSSENNESAFGGFIGGGFSYTYSNYTNDFVIPGTVDLTEQVKGTSYGPLVNGGIRALIGERSFFLRAFYKIGLESAKFKTFGVSAGISL